MARKFLTVAKIGDGRPGVMRAFQILQPRSSHSTLGHPRSAARRFAAGHNDVRTLRATRSISGEHASSEYMFYPSPRPGLGSTPNASLPRHLREPRFLEWISTDHRFRPLCEAGSGSWR